METAKMWAAARFLVVGRNATTMRWAEWGEDTAQSDEGWEQAVHSWTASKQFTRAKLISYGISQFWDSPGG